MQTTHERRQRARERSSAMAATVTTATKPGGGLAGPFQREHQPGAPQACGRA